MTSRSMITAIGLIGSLALGSASSAAPQRNAERIAARAVLAEKHQSVQGVSADARAVLLALERDPTLARQLFDNPRGAEALLRAKGLRRAEHIVVTPGGGGTEQRTITITIKIDDVTITIVIKL